MKQKNKALSLKMRNFNISSRIVYVLSLAFCTILLFTDLRILAYPIILVCTALILPIGNKCIGFLTKIVISFLLIVCIQQVFGIGFWYFDKSFTYVWSLFLIALPLAIYIIFVDKKKLKFSFNVQRTEIVAIIITCLTLAIVSFGALRSNPIDQQTTKYMITGFDNSTHLSILLSLYDNQGYLYGPFEEVQSELVYKSLSAYPQGWHLSNSTIWRGVSDNISTANISTLLLVFYTTAVFWYGLLVYLSLILSFALATVVKKSKLTLIDLVYPVIFNVILQIGSLLYLLKNGFVNYIGIIAYILCLLLVALLIKNNDIRKKHFLVMGALFCTGIAYSWLLAFPVGILIYFLVLFEGTGIKALRNSAALFKQYFIYIVLAAFILLTSGIQIYLQLTYSTVPNNLNATGGIEKTNTLFLLLSTSAIVLLLIKDAIARSTRNFIIIATTSQALLCGFIYLYQYTTVGLVNYYFEKTAILLTIVVTIILGSLLSGKFARMVKLNGYLMSLLFAFGVLLILPVITAIDLNSVRYVTGKDRKLSDVTSSQILAIANRDTVLKNNVIVYKELDYEEDVITTHFINVLSREQNNCTSRISWALITNDDERLLELVSDCAAANTTTNYHVITSSKNFDSVKERLADSLNVEVILSN